MTPSIKLLLIEGVRTMIKGFLLSCVGVLFSVLLGMGIYFNFVSVGWVMKKGVSTIRWWIVGYTFFTYFKTPSFVNCSICSLE